MLELQQESAQAISGFVRGVAPQRKSVWAFFLLVFALSVPFALLGAVSGTQLAPGIPVSALGFVCPALAASILVYRENGKAGVKALLRRSVDFHRTTAKRWYAPVVLVMPGVTLLAYAVLRLTHSPVKLPHVGVVSTPVMFAAFFGAALGEELGWSGYAIDALQADMNALEASVVLGLVWAAWHIVAMVQAGQSPGWMAWGCVDMVATRIIMVRLYDATGKSVFAMALYHAMANVSAKTVFPGGSYPGERVISVLLVAAVFPFLLTARSGASRSVELTAGGGAGPFTTSARSRWRRSRSPLGESADGRPPCRSSRAAPSHHGLTT